MSRAPDYNKSFSSIDKQLPLLPDDDPTWIWLQERAREVLDFFEAPDIKDMLLL